MKKSARTLLATSALASLAFIAVPQEKQKMDLLGLDKKVELSSGEVTVPVYNVFTGLKPGMCSAYVRKAAKEMFDVDYSYSHAWDRIHNDRVIAELDGYDSLEQLISKDQISQGDVIGASYPNSPNMRGLDSQGNLRQFSHNLLYIGESKTEEPLFAHRVAGSTKVDSLSKLKKKGLIPKYAIGPKTSSD